MVFLDTNILLEITLANRPRLQEVTTYLRTIDDETAISLLTVHLVMHFGRKEQIEDTYLHALFSQSALISIASEDYIWATENERGNDFEDALQLAAAIRAGCSTFVTLDAALARRYASLPIKIVLPA